MAVFGSMHMGASRLVNLQRHRIAQCRSIVIRILGDEGVPVQGTSINHVGIFDLSPSPFVVTFTT